jgi:CheY-like chemotaxis protein
MDINMPELDGFETTKILKRLEKENKTSEIVIIACTAVSQNKQK